MLLSLPLTFLPSCLLLPSLLLDVPSRDWGPGSFKGEIEALSQGGDRGLVGGPGTCQAPQMRLLARALSLPAVSSFSPSRLASATPRHAYAHVLLLPGTDFLADPSTTSAAATVKPTQKRPCSSCTSARPALSCAVDRRPTIRPCQGTPTIGQRGPRRPASQCRDEDDRRGRTKMHQNVSILLTGLSPPPRPASPR